MSTPLMQALSSATYRLTIMSVTALRDSPHSAGIITTQGAR